jgi:hypothetical protein
MVIAAIAPAKQIPVATAASASVDMMVSRRADELGSREVPVGSRGETASFRQRSEKAASAL